jgi:arginine utilization protein RocB
MKGRIDISERTRALALALTKQRSMNGTSHETSFAEFLRDLIGELPYFRANPRDIWIESITHDTLLRGVVVGFVRGQGQRTVVLTGHFDTVGVDDYQELEPWATEPVELAPRIVRRLEATGEDPQALDDLKSGRFLPGRGLLDMKSGLAAGLAVLEAFSEQENRHGNLLFLAVPDEEDSSIGMRFAASLLSRFAKDQGINLSLVVNLDALGDEGDGSKGQAVALGAIGKTLLSAYVIGQETHACYPFDGLSASLIAAELVRLIECSPDFADRAGPPPSTLTMRDLKGAYSVTTPSRAWCSWNIISHGRKATDILARVTEDAQNSMDELVQHLSCSAERLGAVDSFKRFERKQITIFTYESLLRQIETQQPTFRTKLDRITRDISAQIALDLPTRAQKILEHVWREGGLSGPAVVFGFASMPYPATKTLKEISPLLFYCVVQAMTEVSNRHRVSIHLSDRLDVIADTSFLGPIDLDDLNAVAANTPIWSSSIRWDTAKAPTPGLPTINAGPWGRGYHRWLERVQIRYAFEVLPDLLTAICHSVLCANENEP